MIVTRDVVYTGVKDYGIRQFEGQYSVPDGMMYNSYVILDDKIAVVDTVDIHFSYEWLDNIRRVLDGRKPDYLIVQHMEPDHSASLRLFLKEYPDTVVVSSSISFAMIKNFYGSELQYSTLPVTEGSTLLLGSHVLRFITANMVHWPEVIVTYDMTAEILFSADAFGKFGTDESTENWKDEARRYYIGIVGKYGDQVQTLLKKVSDFEINTICPLHGPVLTDTIVNAIELYDIWSSYRAETDGVLIAYNSVYGNTKKAVMMLADMLENKGCTVVVDDVASKDISACVSDAFRFSKTVFAATTVDAGVFPAMKDFINRLTDHNYKNRVVGLIENGSWIPAAAGNMRSMLEICENISFCDTTVKILSSLSLESTVQLEKLAEELCASK